MTQAPDAAEFEALRPLLFTVAYEMLEVAADAEDVVQETWLRWADVDHASVRDERAFLARIATRQALNRLRTLQRRRESYVGPWLPEPLLTAPDVVEDVELTEAVSMAMLRVLDSLQLTAGHAVSTPVDWQEGQDVIIAGSVSDEAAKEKYPEGWKSEKPYLRWVPQPAKT